MRPTLTAIEQRQRAALGRACKIVGSQSELARLLGGKVKQAHVHWWLETGRVPARHCPAIERETKARGQAIRCEDLCDQADWAVLRGSSAKAVQLVVVLPPGWSAMHMAVPAEAA